jgi:serine/threonine-protein kinase
MEYLEGVELANVIDREGALGVKRALSISTQICRALSAAHAAGIIHRDLKPENVYLTSREGTSDFVKVLDFGIAKSTEAEEARNKKLTHPGMAMGTPEYMAPEQAAGKPADERCDVYAVGAILYEMLTGVAPYDGENFMEILTKKATVEPVPVRELRSEIPEAVEELLLQAMARDPANRPPSMEAFEYELTKCLSGRSQAVANVLGLTPGRDSSDSLRVSEALAAQSSAPVVMPSASRESASTVAPLDSVPEISGGGYRALGWIFFSLVLLLGAAAVFYVANGESGARRRAAVPAEPASTAAVPADNPAELAPKKKEPKKQSPKPKRPRKPENKKPSGQSKTRGRPSIPKNERQAAILLNSAKGHIAKMEWRQAEDKYNRVVKSGFRRRQGFLGLSDAAFQQGDFDKAIAYARKAGNGITAKMALANAYFKRGDQRTALKLYEQVLRKSPGHKEARKNASVARKALRSKK